MFEKISSFFWVPSRPKNDFSSRINTSLVSIIIPSESEIVRSFEANMDYLWFHEDERKFVREVVFQNVQVRFYVNNAWSVANSPSIPGYSLSPDIDVSNFDGNKYLQKLITTEGEIGIYPGRMRNQQEMTNTLNHEINHFLFRFLMVKRFWHLNGFAQRMKSGVFKGTLECFWFLEWAHSVAKNGDTRGALEFASGWIGDGRDNYGIGSRIWRDILAIQNKFWILASGKPKEWKQFQQFCRQIRDGMMWCVAYDPRQIWVVANLLNSKNDVAILDWAEKFWNKLHW